VVTNPLSFRLLVDPRQPGPRNMAVDEALLRCMADGGDPVLRLYGFAPPCLSLGRFQSAGDLGDAALRRRDGVDLVRRPTGGRAVLHDDEVTYAVVLGRCHLQPFTKRAAYRASAAILLRLLPALGVQGTIQPGAAGTAPHEPDPDCYRTTAEYEITAGHKKLVGSAQTTTRDAALQHGTIPLSSAYLRIGSYLRPRSPAAPGPPPPAATSVAHETDRRPTYEEALHLLATAAATRLETRPSALSADEARLAQELEQTRYACRQWTCAR
jgi:lipoate-protein ligase A